MNAVAGYLRKNAVRRGLFGGNRWWMALGILIYGRRLVRKIAGRDPEVVYSERLEPGQSLLITHERDAAIMEG